MFAFLGRNPTGERLRRIRLSPHYRQGHFHNLIPTQVSPESKLLKVLGEWLNRPKTVRPPQPLPFVKTDLTAIDGETPQIVWFGHSSYLLVCRGYRLLVDPVLCGHASPFNGMVKAFAGADEYRPADFPPIDLLVITHDHYDHLDYETIRQLKPRIKKVVCALGVGSHLESWGMDPALITELDWHEGCHPDPQVHLTAEPARHFTGRGASRYKTLWCSYVLDFFGHRIFLGGDSGYDGAFAETGKTHGPFALALLECGQYGKYWPDIHMTPEQTVQAGLELKAEIVMPVHWGKFQLSVHPWNEPVERFVAEAALKELAWTMPKNGEVMSLDERRTERWWG